MLKQRSAAVHESQQPRIEARQMLGHVSQIAPQDRQGVVVSGDVDDLRHVDDRQSLRRHQDVVRGQIAMDPTAAQQLLYLQEDLQMGQRRRFRRKGSIGQARGGCPALVDDQLHEQNIFVQEIGLGHANARIERSP